jgi:acetyl esterase
MSISSFLTRPLDRLEHDVARRLLELAARLSPRVLRSLSRGADDVSLAPDIALMLAVLRRTGVRGISEGSVALARARMRRETRVHAGAGVPVGAVHELTYPGATGPLRARHYVPRGCRRAPLLVFAHGGGFALGDLDTHDLPCRTLCAWGDMHVLSIEYRRAPEHPFPAAIDDAYAALRFAQQQASRLGADPAHVAIGGDSAGANLAAVVSQLAKLRGDPLPVLQLLIYPVVDSTRDAPSFEAFADGFMLTRADIHWFRDAYLGATDRSDPRVSPLLAPDLSGLPPAIVVSAGFDPLRDEGEAYARALEAAGNRVLLRRFPQLVHGFINMSAVSPSAREAMRELTQLTREALARGVAGL